LKKKLIIAALAGIVACPLFSQRSTELGLFLGASTYYGELNRLDPFYYPFPAAGIIARRSYNKHYSAKAMISATALQSADSHFTSRSPYQAARNHSSFVAPLVDLIVQAEYNFFPIGKKKDEGFFSPYIHLGLGAFIAAGTESPLQASIPFGLGAKIKLTENVEMRAEYIFHATFTDNLDGLPVMRHTEPYRLRQLAQASDKDQFAIYGISLLYTVARTKTACPVFDSYR
jgi:hypothetical protein